MQPYIPFSNVQLYGKMKLNFAELLATPHAITRTYTSPHTSRFVIVWKFMFARINHTFIADFCELWLYK